MNAIEIGKLITPVLKKYHIAKAGVFGSFAKNESSQASDVDILVELDSKTTLLTFVGIKLELEELLKKPVDLVEYKSLKPELKQSILKSEVRIYG